MKQETCDVVIVGAGIAGLSFALYLSERLSSPRIMLLTKGELPESNTWLAQGGIAAVVDTHRDTFESHIEDTILAGRGFADRSIVEMVVQEAPSRIADLIRWGVSFDLTDKGFDLHREGGHSAYRILHRKDFTGREIFQKLHQLVASKPNIRILSQCMAYDLLIDNCECKGVFYHTRRDRQLSLLQAKAVMLATGGGGQMFEFTTNPRCATGDGVALASRAGAEVQDMQHYQFHPTALYHPHQKQTCLISEAVRGYGAHMVNDAGERFLFAYDSRGELATRDVVTNAVFDEIRKTGKKHVFLRVNHLDLDDFQHRFPTIWKQCKEVGLDLSKDHIPVLPAAHYQCGGIQVNAVGQTTISRLYAGGECARTGLHGANRLASNSLLEAIVFSFLSAADISKWLPHESPNLAPSVKNHVTPTPATDADKRKAQKLKQHLQKEITAAFHQRNYLPALLNAYEKITEWRQEAEVWNSTADQKIQELLNLLECGSLLINALIREKKVLSLPLLDTKEKKQFSTNTL